MQKSDKRLTQFSPKITCNKCFGRSFVVFTSCTSLAGNQIYDQLTNIILIHNTRFRSFRWKWDDNKVLTPVVIYFVVA